MEEYKGWTYVPKYLKSKTYCAKERLIVKGIEPSARVYQKINNRWIDLYDTTLLKKKKPLTEKQLKALQKAQKTREERYTCVECGTYDIKEVSTATKLCSRCQNDLRGEQRNLLDANKALNKRLSWVIGPNKGNYVILDVESTGLYSEDEVIEIGILDLYGRELYNSLIRPGRNIPEEVTLIHGINDKMVAGSPTIDEVIDILDGILQGKTILAYNADFDCGMLEGSLRKRGITRNYKWECVMHNEMAIWQTSRFISLAMACSVEKCQQSHRAIEDCKLVYHLVNDTERIQELIKRNQERVNQIENRLRGKIAND